MSSESYGIRYTFTWYGDTYSVLKRVRFYTVTVWYNFDGCVRVRVCMYECLPVYTHTHTQISTNDVKWKDGGARIIARENVERYL